MRKIKVCHLTSAHKSYDIRIFMKECISVAKVDNMEVTLIAQGENRNEKGVRVLGLGEISDSRIMRLIRFTKQVYKKALEVDADIYHFHDPELLPYALRLKKKGKVVIFDSHENTYAQIKIKEYIPLFIRSIIAEIYYKYETYVCQKLDAVIFPCPFMGEHPFNGRCKNTVFVNNYPIQNANMSKNRNKPLKCCYIGSLSENRGVTVLLETFKDLNIPLILAGEFESKEYYNNLEQNNLLDNIDYRGICTYEEVLSIYDEAQIGISNLLNIGQYPLIDTFPTKVYEYMNNGLAVIVSDYDYSRKIISKYGIGISVDPSDVNAIKDAVLSIANDEDVMRLMGENGKKLISEKFNWNIEAKKIVKLYYDSMQ